MFNLEIGSIIETYSTIDDAMNSCFEVFPEAMPDGDWKSNSTETWMDIRVSCMNNTILGKIIEVI